MYIYINVPPGRKWNVVVVSFYIQCILRDAVFFHINWLYWFCEFLHPAGGLPFLVFLPQRQANFEKKTVILQWCLFLQRRWNFTRWFVLCRILATYVPQSENRSEWSASVKRHCQLRMRKGTCFDWEPDEFGMWVFICVNGACVDTQRLIAKSFGPLKLEVPFGFFPRNSKAPESKISLKYSGGGFPRAFALACPSEKRTILRDLFLLQELVAPCRTIDHTPNNCLCESDGHLCHQLRQSHATLFSLGEKRLSVSKHRVDFRAKDHQRNHWGLRFYPLHPLLEEGTKRTTATGRAAHATKPSASPVSGRMRARQKNLEGNAVSFGGITYYS